MLLKVGIIYTLLLAFPLAEILFYPGITRHRLGVAPIIFVLIALGVSIFFRFKLQTKIQQQVGYIGLYIVAPILSAGAVMMRAVELITYPNFIYSNLHVDINQTAYLSLSIFLICLPFLRSDLIKKNFKVAILALSMMLYQFILVSWSHPVTYTNISREDSLIEYLTFFAFLAGSIFAFLNLRLIPQIKLIAKQKKLLRVLSCLMGLGLLVIAGEEISWAQRIVKIDTPESLAQVNTQGELNIHNNHHVFPLVYQAYLVVNLYGLTSWVFYAAAKDRLPAFGQTILRLCTSRWYLALLFIPNLVYVLLRFRYGNEVIDLWEELSELYLAVGLMMITYLNYWYLKKKL